MVSLLCNNLQKQAKKHLKTAIFSSQISKKDPKTSDFAVFSNQIPVQGKIANSFTNFRKIKHNPLYKGIIKRNRENRLKSLRKVTEISNNKNLNLILNK